MLPYIIIHNAVSPDGRLDGFVPDIGLYYELAMRWKEDATLVGVNTLLKAPIEEGESRSPVEKKDSGLPLMVVPDSRGRVSNWDYLRRQPHWRDVIVLCSRITPRGYLSSLKQQKIDFIVTGSDHVNLRTSLEALNARYGVKIVRVDSGGTLNGALLRAGLVSEVSLLVHPCLVGGTTPSSIFRATDLTSAEGAVPLKLISMERLRDDIIWLRYQVVK